MDRHSGLRTDLPRWRNDDDLAVTSTIGTSLDPEQFGNTVPKIAKEAGHWADVTASGAGPPHPLLSIRVRRASSIQQRNATAESVAGNQCPSSDEAATAEAKAVRLATTS